MDDNMKDMQPRSTDTDTDQKSNRLAELVDKAIENSKRMENDPEYRREIQRRSR